jgi:Ca2+-binding EF-hand superfamily protein
MKIDIEKQRTLLETLGGIEGQLSTIEILKKNLDKEKEKLNSDKEEILKSCQHTDEDGKMSISGGNLYAWCQVCGKLLSDEEIAEIENNTSS